MEIAGLGKAVEREPSPAFHPLLLLAWAVATVPGVVQPTGDRAMMSGRMETTC